MALSPLQIKYYIAAALFAALVVFEAVTRMSDRHKIRTGQAEDLTKGDTKLVRHNLVQRSKGRVWAEGLLIIAAGVSMVAAMTSMLEYQKYGAFYDSSWRSPEVEDWFEFDASRGGDLEAVWRADPDGFDWNAQRVVLVKLGCEDCYRVAEAIHGLEADGYVVVFSRSDLGKAFVEKFGVTYVPTVVMNGMTVQLRSGSSMVPQDGGDHGEEAREIYDGLMKGGLGTDENGEDPAAKDPNYTKYGTKAAIEAAMEEEAEKAGEAGSAGAGE